MSQASAQNPSVDLSLPALVEGELQSWQSLTATLGEAPRLTQFLLAGWVAALARLPLDEEIKPLLLGMKAGLSELLIREPQLLADRQGWLRPCLTELLNQVAVWYDSGKENRDFHAAVQLFVAELKQGEQAAKPLLELIARQQQRAVMLESRVRDNELGMAKIQKAQLLVSELLNQLVGVRLPETMNQFLRTSLRSELQFVLINEGEEAQAWKSWNLVVEHLGQMFPSSAEDAEPVNRQQLYREAQILLGLLNEQVNISAAQQQTYDQGVEDFRERLFEQLRGQEVPLVAFAPLADEDELSRAGVSLSSAVSRQAASLKPGQWFLFSPEENQWIRCKLLLCPPDYASLFFVNRNGQRVLVKTPQEFSACLATGVARPLDVEDMYQRLLQLALAPLVKKAEQLLASRANAVVEQELPVCAEPVAAAVPDAPATPATDPQSAAEKARQEARELALLEQQREGEIEVNTEPSPEESYETRQQFAAHQVNSLNIGALLDIELDGQWQRCKLVAIMRANGFYIFTDRRGEKVAELEKTDLVELLAKGAARVQSQGDNFEGQLTKVVKTLRREL
jgi:hypothetical protein